MLRFIFGHEAVVLNFYKQKHKKLSILNIISSYKVGSRRIRLLFIRYIVYRLINNADNKLIAVIILHSFINSKFSATYKTRAIDILRIFTSLSSSKKIFTGCY